jgi:pseudo-rSAM protein
LNNHMTAPYWLWIEPYVHISVKGNSALLYNTLSGKKLEYFDQPETIRLLKKLLRKENLLVVPMKEKERCNPPISNFVEDIKEHFMGDTERVEFSKGKPIQIKPLPNVQSDVKKAMRDPTSAGKSILTYLSELTIYINDYSIGSREMHNGFSPLLHKQLLFPFVDKKSPGKNLPLEVFIKMISELSNSGLQLINIIGGNILDYPAFEPLCDFLRSIPQLKRYHLHYIDGINSPEGLKIILEDSGRVNLWGTFPLEEATFSQAALLARENENLKFTFAIGNESEIGKSEGLVRKHRLKNFSMQPFYNGRNLDFFRECVFIQKEDIAESRPTQREITARMTVNENFFGKLTVKSNGDIYSNLNSPKLGNIYRSLIPDAIYKELYSRKDWLRCRPSVLPCRQCLYHALCPSISNYELILRRNNLCTVLDN